jgi:hemerythrin-like domain-containing protein
MQGRTLEPERAGARPSPSAVRCRILSDHEVLRGALDVIEALAREVLQGGSSVGPELHKRTRELEQRLHTHMELEERILVPALHEADAWGRERVERLQEEHARQRQIMDVLRSWHPWSDRSTVELALIVWGFARLLREDMASEERVSLAEDVLRDDPIRTGVEPD